MCKIVTKKFHILGMFSYLQTSIFGETNTFYPGPWREHVSKSYQNRYKKIFRKS